MRLNVESTHFGGAVVVTVPEVFSDERGFFQEDFRRDLLRNIGITAEFVQENHSGSVRNVVRGLHFQYDPPMAKLMRVTSGTAFLVAVDIRKGSPTLGKWVGLEASAKNRKQMWAPSGFARGFCILSDFAEIQYLCTGLYNAAGESGIAWNDPTIAVDWPVKNPILSAKDTTAQTLAQWLGSPHSNHFQFPGNQS